MSLPQVFSVLFGIFLFCTLPAAGQYCTENCNIPVAGYGLYSLVFDPSTQDAASLNVISPSFDTIESFTLEAYIFLTVLDPSLWQTRPIFFKGGFNRYGTSAQENNGLTFMQEFLLAITSRGTLRFTMGGDLDYGFDVEAGATDPNALVPMGQWVHVAVTVDWERSEATIYQDGALIARGPWLIGEGPYRVSLDGGVTLTPRVLGGRIQIGLYNPLFTEAPYRFQGRVDELRIWNRTLTRLEVSTLHLAALQGDEPGLLGYFPLNEGQGSTTTFPWPLTGPGRVAPASVPVITGTLTYLPLNNLEKFWSTSELVIEQPPTPFGVTGELATAGRDLQIYAIVDNSDSVQYLRYRLTVLPQAGYLTQGNEEIDLDSTILVVGSDNNFPVLHYSPNASWFGNDSFQYIAISSGDEQTESENAILVPLINQCRFADSCGICNGDQSLCDCLNIPYGNATYDKCGVCNGTNACEGCDGVPFSGLKYDECGVCNGNNSCLGCDSVPFSGEKYDTCGVCGGNGTTCPKGCDGVGYSTLKYDECGVCNGTNECVGCNGKPFSGEVYDVCGVCNGGIGNNSIAKDRCGVCFGNNSCLGCDGIPYSGKIIDACFACVYPDEANLSCSGCNGVPYSNTVFDVCGVCGGNGSTCIGGCDHQPGSHKVFDVCGVCGGDGSTCAGCDGVPQPNATLRTTFDACGVCGGNGSSCADCNGVPNGPNPPGPCGCTDKLSCLDCTGCPYGPAKYDACGVCGGDNSTCAGCNGVPYSGMKYDYCGVCGGNDSSCSASWCDESLPGSTYDACGVCGGNNSTCQCVEYIDYNLARMDCILLNYTLSSSLVYIDQLLTTLQSTLDQISSSFGALNPIIGPEIRNLNQFSELCIDEMCSELSGLKEILSSV